MLTLQAVNHNQLPAVQASRNHKHQAKGQPISSVITSSAKMRRPAAPTETTFSKPRLISTSIMSLTKRQVLIRYPEEPSTHHIKSQRQTPTPILVCSILKSTTEALQRAKTRIFHKSLRALKRNRSAKRIVRSKGRRCRGLQVQETISPKLLRLRRIGFSKRASPAIIGTQVNKNPEVWRRKAQVDRA